MGENFIHFEENGPIHRAIVRLRVLKNCVAWNGFYISPNFLRFLRTNPLSGRVPSTSEILTFHPWRACENQNFYRQRGQKVAVRVVLISRRKHESKVFSPTGNFPNVKTWNQCRGSRLELRRNFSSTSRGKGNPQARPNGFEREAEEKHEQPSRHEESIKLAEWFRAVECN